MNRKKVEQKTYEYHASGLCCTEAIVKSLTELYGNEPSDIIPKIGSGFCKGIGMTGEDVCGTVVGVVISLGYLFGRMKPEESFEDAISFSAEFRKRFIQKYETTNCSELLKRFNGQEEMDCKRMTADAAGIIADLIDEGRSSDFSTE